MKKRILALALAGTTAFSVFGAVASADYVGVENSAHNKIDYYESYSPVTTITAKNTVVTATTQIYAYTAPNGKTTYTTAKFNDIVANESKYGYLNTDESKTVYLIADLTAVGYKKDKDFTVVTKQIVPTEETVSIYNPATKETKDDVATYAITTSAEVGYAKVDGAKGEIVADAADIYSNNGYAVTGSVKGTITGTEGKYLGWNNTLTGIMDVPVNNATVYLYDFWNAGMYAAGYANLAYAGTDAVRAAALDPTAAKNGTVYVYEDGEGTVYAGERYEVTAAFEAFLSELGVNYDDPYFETYAEFESNYMGMVYGDPVYEAATGKYWYDIDVDLYNISALLADIWELRAQEGNTKAGIAGWENATTSNLIYIMQQYDKYIGNYFEMMEVEGTEWGELMISLLNAANEEDFGHRISYKNYVNEVEELTYAYETATTLAQITKAEQGMYNLLTGSEYKSNLTASAAAINATMGGMYWNVAKIPGAYTTAAVTEGTGYAGKYVSGDTYTLYPMSDYAQSGNDNAVETGNKATASYVAGDTTDEYQWMWNVYQLAYNMSKAGYKYQGSLDAVNEALVEAIADLTVTDSPRGSAVAAMEETVEDYAGKIDTDYVAYDYALYTSANAFAEVAEGKAQVANAEAMVEEAGSSLAWQSAQVTVTKNDIESVKDAIDSAEAAIKAIQNSDEYNAAQVTALNKAIDAAEGIVDLYDGIAHKNNKYVQSVNTVYSNKVGDKDQILKSDIAEAIEAIDTAIKGSKVIEGWSKNADGAWQYGEDGEYVAEGWKKIGSSWYYFEEGTAVESDWRKLDGKWYYLNKNCAAAYGWCKVDGEWYYFDGSNAMKTGWVKVDGSWYYLAASGKMVTGEQTIDGVKYNFSTESNSLGQML